MVEEVKQSIKGHDISYKVFINGVDLTSVGLGGTGGLVNRVEVSIERNAVTKALIEIQCPNNELIITEEDAELINLIQSEIPENNVPVNAVLDVDFGNEIKNKILNKKIAKRFFNRFQKLDFLYTFESGESCLHFSDPVRIFVFRDGNWYYLFTGIITLITVSTGVDGEKSIHLTCKSQLVLLERASFVNSLGVFEEPEIKKLFSAESLFYMQNAFIGVFVPRVFAEFSIFKQGINQSVDLFDALTNLVYGDISNEDYGQSLAINQNILGRDITYVRNHFAVGRFDYKKSLLAVIGSDAILRANELAFVQKKRFYSIEGILPTVEDRFQTVWFNHFDMKVKNTDLIELTLTDIIENFGGEAGFLKLLIGDRKLEELSQDEVVDIIGSNPDIYAMDMGGLKVLIPSSITSGIADMAVPVTLVESLGKQNYFYDPSLTKLGILKSILEQLEFLFYDTPKGDIIVEFPFFDTVPENFGDFAQDYRIVEEDRLSNISVTFDSMQVTNVFAMNPNLFKTKITNIQTTDIVHPFVEMIDKYIPLIGLRLSRIDLSKTFSDEKSARALLSIHASLNLRDAKGFDVQIVLNPVSYFNRCVYVSSVDKIGWVLRVKHSILQESTFATTLSLSAVRGWTGRRNEKDEKIYDTVVGLTYKDFNNFILDYRKIFGERIEE